MATNRPTHLCGWCGHPFRLCTTTTLFYNVAPPTHTCTHTHTHTHTHKRVGTTVRTTPSFVQCESQSINTMLLPQHPVATLVLHNNRCASYRRPNKQTALTLGHTHQSPITSTTSPRPLANLSAFTRPLPSVRRSFWELAIHLCFTPPCWLSRVVHEALVLRIDQRILFPRAFHVSQPTGHGPYTASSCAS
jgi:hypothetical protein